MSTLLASAAATWALVGLIWTIQLVQYPLFAHVGAREFASFHAEHCRRITWVVAPLMLAELVTTLLLLASPPPEMPRWALWVSAGLVATTWLSTALFFVPLHARIRRPDSAEQRALVAANWLRTAAWTARGVLVLWFLV